MGIIWIEYTCTLSLLAAMSSKKSSKRAPPARELDLSNATRGVWLLKVPNYLANVWQLASNNSELGVMRIKS